MLDSAGPAPRPRSMNLTLPTTHWVLCSWLVQSRIASNGAGARCDAEVEARHQALRKACGRALSERSWLATWPDRQEGGCGRCHAQCLSTSSCFGARRASAVSITQAQAERQRQACGQVGWRLRCRPAVVNSLPKRPSCPRTSARRRAAATRRLRARAEAMRRLSDWLSTTAQRLGRTSRSSCARARSPRLRRRMLPTTVILTFGG